jgi:hypothetical protein
MEVYAFTVGILQPIAAVSALGILRASLQHGAYFFVRFARSFNFLLCFGSLFKRSFFLRSPPSKTVGCREIFLQDNRLGSTPAFTKDPGLGELQI